MPNQDITELQRLLNIMQNPDCDSAERVEASLKIQLAVPVLLKEWAELKAELKTVDEAYASESDINDELNAENERLKGACNRYYRELEELRPACIKAEAEVERLRKGNEMHLRAICNQAEQFDAERAKDRAKIEQLRALAALKNGQDLSRGCEECGADWMTGSLIDRISPLRERVAELEEVATAALEWREHVRFEGYAKGMHPKSDAGKLLAAADALAARALDGVSSAPDLPPLEPPKDAGHH